MNDAANVGQESSTLGRRRARRLATLLLGGLFVVLYVAFLLGVVVRKDLLDPELYSQVLAGQNVYERLYTEVLADPAMQDKFKAQVDVDLDLVVEELYAQIVAAGVLVFPPSAIQSATEEALRGVTAYVRGDLPALDASAPPGRLLEREGLGRRIAAAIGSASAEQLSEVAATGPTAPDLAGLRAYVQDLAAGRIRALPSGVATARVAQLPSAERRAMAELLLEPVAATVDAATRRQVEASLASDDLPGAVVTAAQSVLGARLEPQAAALVERLGGAGEVDGLSLAAATLGEARADVIAALNTARSYAERVQRALIPLALVLALLLVAIVWLNSHDLRAALASAGWTLVVASAVGLVLWFLAGRWVQGALAARLAATTGRPPGLTQVLADVVGSLAGAVLSSVLALTLLWLLVGLLALAGAYSHRLSAAIRRGLEPVWPHRRWVLAGLFGLVVLLPLLGRVATARQRAADPPCNGHPELCDRPVNEIVFATTHNSMSITQYGWLWPMQDGTIADQLEAGVRALLVDTHYIEDTEGEAAFLDTLSPAEREVAEAAIAAFASDVVGPALCHGSCRLGATAFGRSLDELNAFLEAHPREVVVLVIQDEITAEDTAAAVEEHALASYVYAHQGGEPWPTLRQMIDADQRLIVMAENEGPPPDWYANAWEVTEETPYTFVYKEDFSCAPNRGGTGKPFFLLNHWIQRGAPNRADAAVVNAYDFLLDRARKCAAERGKVPNFVAVNFYGQGDLFRVVDALNGVGGGSPPP